MLQFVGVSNPPPERVELDDYIPIIIRWGEPDYWGKIYWSIGERDSLLEIEIDPQIKIIRAVKVVLASKVAIQPSEFRIDRSLPSDSGIPICNTEDWSSSIEFTDGYHREEGTFQLHVGSNHFCVVFDNRDVVSQIVCGRVRFGLDHNNYLCLLEVVGFTDEDMKRFTETLIF